MKHAKHTGRFWSLLLLTILFLTAAGVFILLPGVAPAAAESVNAPSPAYTVFENGEELVAGENIPLAGFPAEENCCVLHLFLGLCVLGVVVYGAADDRRRQRLAFETRRELL